MKRWILRLTTALAAIAVAASTTIASAQVTTGSIRGIVTDSDNRPLEGARITAIHTPSGTQYIGATRADGRFTIPGVRVGGPYQVSATAIGFARQSRDDIQVALGASSDLVFSMSAVATQLSAVTVTSEGGELSTTRTGAATSVRREALEQLPTISRRISDFTRLTPQASGNNFAGQDNRLNNITIDGAAFNNAFGLGGQPGDRTGVAPISLDAVEAVQVNIAPFDVRQGGFVGAAINTVTRSGNNNFEGSVYYNVRDQEYVGRTAGRRTFNPGTFSFDQIGFRLGGPILKDKLFFFVSYEQDENESPGNTNLPRDASQVAGGNITRVLRSDLNDVRDTLISLFGYNPGEYEGYPGLTPSQRLTARVDYALSDRNKFSFRYTSLDSETDVLRSTSSSLGFGRNNFQSMSYTGSNYTILENIDSYAAEWNSLLSDRMSNQLLFTYTKQDESRGAIGNLFPFVDILDAGQTYISFGSEPFTPNNELRYSNWQLQNNFTIYGNRHDLTFGVNIEGYESENVFFPGSQSAYVYPSLAQFYADARAFADACGTGAAALTCNTRTATTTGPRRFQVRYNNIPGQEKPIQPLEVNFMGAYIQDEYRVGRGLTLTGGVRVDVVSFGNTARENSQVNGLNFRDEDGQTVQYNTAKLPDATPLISPRLGFNYDMRGNGQTILRGGTGIFTGRPAYVWISNQIGNNGILTGFEQADNTTATGVADRPFHPNPDRYKPTAVTGAPAASYELALTDQDFKFPQVWRSNLALDHRFENGWLVTTEFIWGRDVNGVYYINANLPEADAAFTGPDNRPRWVSDKCPTVSGTQTNRLNCNITSAIVLKNQNVGETYNASVSIERSFRNGFYTKGAFAYGTASNTVDAGSIAFGSWNNNQHTGDPNNPPLGNAAGFQGRRAFLVSSYTRDWFGFGNTTVSAFLENFSTGQLSYTFGGDMNGDGGTSNDLIYVPRDASEMNFLPITGSTPFTVAQQQEAFNAYINQDPHLRNRRGQYALRGGLILPQVTRMDLSVSQDLSAMFAGQKNSLQLRLDILNFTNMINSDWGLSQSVINNQPLIPAGATAGGAPQYRMRVVNGQLLNRTFQKNASTGDVWRMQLGLRYTFN